MNIIVNGNQTTASATTLAALLAELEFEGAWLATARNGILVPTDVRAACRLEDGDRIEILSPRQGG
ncbi:sulfur carrier protein ThiS [Mesorhizobium sp. NBSH29]|uniref:sulfur carrier protein ThiS n=1 Tax=Mesorhizobium sp. NBSH29 TaxID=2654249 RepID=UPI0018969446|nr:sulfur carrier protein ThiS [Mesorhizobium sp. NBSH29]QPC88302.1 sulfur carrier protein ThiS [Mesorhizobium sp. NBSH29]